MRRLARHRPSPAMIVAMIALFVALSGASYAALAVNSVGPKQLKKNAVRSAKVMDGSLRGIDIKDGSLTGVELADGSVALVDLGGNSVDSAKVVDGSLKGVDIASGAFLGGGVTVQRTEAAADLGDGLEASYDAFCLPGETAIGGGVRGDATDSEDTNIGSSRPIISTTDLAAPLSGGTFTGWRASVLNPAGAPEAGIKPEVWVVCAKLP